MTGRVFRVAVIALMVTAGCVSGAQTTDGGKTTGPCDPLAPHELPLTLGTVLGVGRDAQGTVYLADEVAATYTDRVFVSSGQTLWRKRVLGTGASNLGTEVDYGLSYEDGSISQDLLVQIRDGATSGMALAPAGSRATVGDPAVTENLEVLAPSAIDSMTLRNLPGEVTIEYVADVDDGHVIVVTRPTDDWTYDDFRVFYGTPDALVERAVLQVDRTKGNATTIDFRLGSAVAHATFTMVDTTTDAGYAVSVGPGSFETGGGAVQTLTERPATAASLEGYQFSCFGS
jgi:hypothetical protein